MAVTEEEPLEAQLVRHGFVGSDVRLNVICDTLRAEDIQDVADMKGQLYLSKRQKSCQYILYLCRLAECCFAAGFCSFARRRKELCEQSGHRRQHGTKSESAKRRGIN